MSLQRLKCVVALALALTSAADDSRRRVMRHSDAVEAPVAVDAGGVDICPGCVNLIGTITSTATATTATTATLITAISWTTTETTTTTTETTRTRTATTRTTVSTTETTTTATTMTTSFTTASTATTTSIHLICEACRTCLWLIKCEGIPDSDTGCPDSYYVLTDLDKSGCWNLNCGADGGCGGFSGNTQKMERGMKIDLRGRPKGYCYNPARDCPKCIEQVKCDPVYFPTLNENYTNTTVFTKEQCLGNMPGLGKLLYNTPENGTEPYEPDEDQEEECWNNGAEECYVEPLPSLYVLPGFHQFPWTDAKTQNTVTAKEMKDGHVDDGLEECPDTIWKRPRKDPSLPKVDYALDASATIYFACRYSSDFNGAMTTVHSWRYRTEYWGLDNVTERRYIGQLPILPREIAWAHEAENVIHTETHAHFNGEPGQQTNESTFLKRKKCQPWCHYLTGFPCTSISNCADCDFCMEEQRCEADCVVNEHNNVSSNPWRCLSSKCTACQPCQDPANRPCPEWFIFSYKCVLYIEDLNWWRINATVHWKTRIIYPMLYDIDCPECLQTQTRFNKETNEYREGGCDNIPCVKEDYFFLPSKAEVGPYFQCPAKCECECDECNCTKFQHQDPFLCKRSDHPDWYEQPDAIGPIMNWGGVPDRVKHMKEPDKAAEASGADATLMPSPDEADPDTEPATKDGGGEAVASGLGTASEACDAVCEQYTQPWEIKCNWKNCQGCSSCTDRATTNTQDLTQAFRRAMTKPVSQAPLLTKIFGGAVVLLCASVVFSALSRSRRGSSGYDLTQQFETGRGALLPADPEESNEALGQKE